MHAASLPAGCGQEVLPLEGSERDSVLRPINRKDFQVSKKIATAVAAVCLLGIATASSFASEAALETEDQKTLYAIGVAMSRQLSNFGLTQGDLALIQQGLVDGVTGKDPKVDLPTYGPKIETFLNARMMAMAEKSKEAGKAFREEAAKEPGAETTAEGMVFFTLSEGTGPAPTGTDTVKVHYHGTFTDGRVFDSSRDGGEPATFALNAVVPCFSQGIQRMKVGGKAKLICPPELAYGERGAPPMVPPGATLIFEVELLEISEAAPAPAPAP
jgi:FKBP-type peptidyl-prolyl cis-trans isomerase